MTQDPRLVLTGDIGDEYPVTEFMGTGAILRVIDGSRSTADIGNGRVMETFSVFSEAEPNVIQANIKAVQNRLALAHELMVNPSPHGYVDILERVKDEVDIRRATVLGGTITPVDQGAVSRTQFYGTAMYVITIDRYALWEHGTPQSFRDSSLSSHGGAVELPIKLTNGTQNGRIKTLMISGNEETRTKKLWAGIKTSRRIALSTFDPEIKVRTGGYVRVNPSSPGVLSFSDWVESSDYLDSTGVRVNFFRSTDWTRALDVLLVDFNSSSATEGDREIYHGKYHLLLRYRTNDNNVGETYGVRAKYGWTTDRNAVTNEAVYLKNSGGNFRYADLGVITIGGDAFSRETISRGKLTNFGIAIQCAVWDNETAGYPGDVNSSYIYLDNMFLVPAENYLHVELGTEIGGGRSNRRAEVYTHANDEVYGMVVERDDKDPVGQYHPPARRVYEGIPVIDGETWSMPVTRSKMVFVADSEEGSLATDATVIMQVHVALRTIGI